MTEHFMVTTRSGDHISAKFAMTERDGVFTMDRCLSLPDHHWGNPEDTCRIIENYFDGTFTFRLDEKRPDYDDMYGGAEWYGTQIIKQTRKYWKATHA